MFGPALREHRLTPAGGDLFNLSIGSAHLRQQDVGSVDLEFPAGPMGPQHAADDLAVLGETLDRLEFSRGVVPGVTLRSRVDLPGELSKTGDAVLC